MGYLFLEIMQIFRNVVSFGHTFEKKKKSQQTGNWLLLKFNRIAFLMHVLFNGIFDFCIKYVAETVVVCCFFFLLAIFAYRFVNYKIRSNEKLCKFPCVCLQSNICLEHCIMLYSIETTKHSTSLNY